MEQVEGPDGATLYVDHDDTERGSKGPIEVVYRDAEGDTRWGFRCAACESLDTAVDTMGRIECNECRNVCMPEEWDAAHE